MRKTYLTLNTLYSFPNVGWSAVLSGYFTESESGVIRCEEESRCVPSDVVQCFEVVRYLGNGRRDNRLIQ